MRAWNFWKISSIGNDSLASKPRFWHLKHSDILTGYQAGMITGIVHKASFFGLKMPLHQSSEKLTNFYISSHSVPETTNFSLLQK